ncbi:MAG: hypothetical protein ACT4QA_14070 [Panacagrimonas sp.]
MTERSGLLLLDTDMLILLTASGTLARVANRLGYSATQLRRLPAAVHQVRKSRRFRDVYGEAVLQQLLPAIAEVSEIDAPTDLELLEHLGEFVDEGEAQLMALAASRECTLLVSGDKRAVLGLAGSEATGCIEALQGRIVSLEAVLWQLVVDMDAGSVRQAFLSVMEHKTLRVVLSEHTVTDKERCLDAIRSYYNDLHRGANGVLYNPAPDSLGTSPS